MDIRITINTDNSAFEDHPEIETARILRVLADRIYADGDIDADYDHPLKDINGNTVGSLTATEEV